MKLNTRTKDNLSTRGSFMNSPQAIFSSLKKNLKTVFRSVYF